jgi:DivIVA domain-containing protein
MPLTPVDVRNVTFSKPPIGQRGYHEGEVDALLDLVQSELARLIEENTDLRAQLTQLDRQRRAVPVDTGNSLRPMEPPGRVRVPIRPPMRTQIAPDADHNVHAAKVLAMAQEMAERMTGEAKAEADGMLNKARAISDQLLSEATTKVEGMVTQARTQADTMLTDARARAETLERQSREKAASLERDAVRQHTEILGAINQEKSVLEDKIDELRTFEREHCTHLTTYLRSQLRELGGHGSAAPVDPMRTQQDLVTAGSAARTETRS